MLACFPNGIAKIATISELPNIFASFFRKILSKMFCRQLPAVESSALLRFSSLFSLLCFFSSVYLFSVSLVCFPFNLSLFSVFCHSLPNFSARHLQRIGFPPYVHSAITSPFTQPLMQPLTRTCTSLIASFTALHTASHAVSLTVSLTASHTHSHAASHTHLHVAHRLMFIPLFPAHFFLSD